MNKKFLLIPVLCSMLAGGGQDSSLKADDQDNSMMMDLSQSDKDDMITKQINSWLMSDTTLSADAKNIQVMTNNGVVTLSGMTANAQEKDKIMKKVKSMQGVQSVNDGLKVKG